MTEQSRLEQLASDLAALSRQIPEAEGGQVGELRALLERIPRPVAPRILSARAGGEEILAGEAPGGLASSLIGQPPGYESGATIGRYPTAIPYNLLKDPAWEGLSDTPVNLGGVETVIGEGMQTPNNPAVDTWFGIAVAGAFTTAQAERRAARYSADFAANSATLGLLLRPSAAGTHELRARCANVTSSIGRAATYLTAAVRFAGWSLSLAQITSYQVVVELYHVNTATVKASRTYTTTDPTDVPVGGILMTAAYAVPSGEAFDTWQLRIRAIVVTNAATASATSAIFAEPRLSWTPIPEAAAYTPAIGAWTPQHVNLTAPSTIDEQVLSAQQFGDSRSRIAITAEAAILLGSGAADPDVELLRSGAGTLRLDVPVAGVDTVLELEATAGRRNWLSLYVAGDSFDRLVLHGDATSAGMELGPGNAAIDLRLYRAAAGFLRVDGGGGDVQTYAHLRPGATQDGGFLLDRSGDSEYRIALYLNAGAPRLEFGGGGGARDVNLYRALANVLKTDDDFNVNGLMQLSASGYIDVVEIAAPTAPGANIGRLFMKDNGAGKTQFCVQFPTGAVQVIATQP